MVNDLSLDQSGFVAQQTVLQAPPSPPEPENKSPKKHKMLIIAGIVGICMLVLLILMVTMSQTRVIQPLPSPTPEATPVVSENQMQEARNAVTEEVMQADPEGQLLPPPQVDMKVDF